MILKYDVPQSKFHHSGWALASCWHFNFGISHLNVTFNHLYSAKWHTVLGRLVRDVRVDTTGAAITGINAAGVGVWLLRPRYGNDLKLSSRLADPPTSTAPLQQKTQCINYAALTFQCNDHYFFYVWQTMLWHDFIYDKQQIQRKTLLTQPVVVWLSGNSYSALSPLTAHWPLVGNLTEHLKKYASSLFFQQLYCAWTLFIT